MAGCAGDPPDGKARKAFCIERADVLQCDRPFPGPSTLAVWGRAGGRDIRHDGGAMFQGHRPCELGSARYQADTGEGLVFELRPRDLWDCDLGDDRADLTWQGRPAAPGFTYRITWRKEWFLQGSLEGLTEAGDILNLEFEATTEPLITR